MKEEPATPSPRSEGASTSGMKHEWRGLTHDEQQRLFDALAVISRFSDPDELGEDSEEEYGLDESEAVSMSYENVLSIARRAIAGINRPKMKTLPPAQAPSQHPPADKLKEDVK